MEMPCLWRRKVAGSGQYPITSRWTTTIVDFNPRIFRTHITLFMVHTKYILRAVNGPRNISRTNASYS